MSKPAESLAGCFVCYATNIDFICFVLKSDQLVTQYVSDLPWLLETLCGFD